MTDPVNRGLPTLPASATLLQHLIEGHYIRPARIVAFNTIEGWSRDVTADIADELRRSFVDFEDVAPSMLEFLERAARHQRHNP